MKKPHIKNSTFSDHHHDQLLQREADQLRPGLLHLRQNRHHSRHSGQRYGAPLQGRNRKPPECLFGEFPFRVGGGAGVLQRVVFVRRMVIFDFIIYAPF